MSMHRVLMSTGSLKLSPPFVETMYLSSAFGRPVQSRDDVFTSRNSPNVPITAPSAATTICDIGQSMRGGGETRLIGLLHVCPLSRDHQRLIDVSGSSPAFVVS